MLSTSRRAGARRGMRVGAVVSSAAVVVTLVPALLLSSPSNASSTRAAASPAAADASLFTATGARSQASLSGHDRRVNPSAYKAFTLNSSALAGRLAAAPDESAKGSAPATISGQGDRTGLILRPSGSARRKSLPGRPTGFPRP